MSAAPLATPESSTTPIAFPTTRPMPHSSSEAHYQSGDLSSRRRTVSDELRPRIVPVDMFFASYLPPLPMVNGTDRADVDVVLARLKTQGVINGDGRWSAFPDEPRNMKAKENVIFGRMQTVDDACIAACQHIYPALKPTLGTVHRPDKCPGSVKYNSSRPDACQYLCPSPSVVDAFADDDDEDLKWEVIASPREYKTDERDASENHAQLVWGMHHIMWTDYSRRFVFGVSIENTATRVWMSNRAVALVTQPFNFLEEPRRLLHLLLSLSYASPSELGWDPTVRRTESNEILIDVPFDTEIKTYRVLKLVRDTGAQAMQGRGCRTFRARPEPPREDDETVYIKDTWSNIDRPREGDTIKQLIADIIKTEKWKGKDEEVKSHFIEVVHYGDISIDDEPDTTLNLIMRSADADKFPVQKIQYSSQYRFPNDAIGSHTSLPEHAAKRRKLDGNSTTETPIQHRVHHRMVTRDAGSTLHDMDDLSDIFTALDGASTGLDMMNDGGWIHRDVSLGNALGRGGRLGDLEYSKEYASDGPAHPFRTGTRDFMAVEVHQSSYMLLPINTRWDIAFRHNIGHDFESLAWMAMFMLMTSVATASDAAPDLGELFRKFEKLFPGNANESNSRKSFLLSRRTTEGDPYYYLPPSFQITEITAPLISLLEALSNAYTSAYEDLPAHGGKAPSEQFAVLQPAFSFAFKRLAKTLVGKKLTKFTSLNDLLILAELEEAKYTPVSPSMGRKRKRNA